MQRGVWKPVLLAFTEGVALGCGFTFVVWAANWLGVL